MAEAKTLNRSILIVDDHEPIHDDFREVLIKNIDTSSELESLEEDFFGDSESGSHELPEYKMESAYQGQDAFEMIRHGFENGTPYALSFVDVRMPPGWDGIETIKRIREVDQDVQIVICTAYSDYSWGEIHKEFGSTHSLLFLRKPFDHTEVRQLASALTEKWNFAKQARMNLAELETLVRKRTLELENSITELKQANDKIKVLDGLVPICSSCKKIRDDKGFWSQLEQYITKHSSAQFSHGICPDCIKELYPDYYKMLQDKKKDLAE